jgi:hypothetical protein
MEGPVISAVETVIDNGKHGTRTVKFETGLLARQAAGSVTAYLDDETMLLSATTAGRAGPPRTRSSPAGSSTGRCARPSRRACATRSRSSSP